MRGSPWVVTATSIVLGPHSDLNPSGSSRRPQSSWVLTATLVQRKISGLRFCGCGTESGHCDVAERNQGTATLRSGIGALRRCGAESGHCDVAERSGPHLL
ncbi:hypothetical protein BV898_03623 [Hypsibius exemplaris]|uniref:Uncharacterized protein n=1 Tax=Hypsibius exemplaris TaxID=2072580 RepID=A0A1W0X511_HYPEX|nr:hypothetical protein BV898_03623 [Hypsibius exemplaris]